MLPLSLTDLATFAGRTASKRNFKGIETIPPYVHDVSLLTSSEDVYLLNERVSFISDSVSRDTTPFQP